jgi:hypothetical protein
MSDQNYGTVGPPTNKTLANCKQARAHSAWCGPAHVEWKLRTGRFRWLPVWSVMSTELWNEGPVRWLRGYWLTCGLSVYWALPERRLSINVYYPKEEERRTYPYGTRQIHS